MLQSLCSISIILWWQCTNWNFRITGCAVSYSPLCFLKITVCYNYKTNWKDVCDMFSSHTRTRDITVTKCTFLYHDQVILLFWRINCIVLEFSCRPSRADCAAVTFQSNDQSADGLRTGLFTAFFLLSPQSLGAFCSANDFAGMSAVAQARYIYFFSFPPRYFVVVFNTNATNGIRQSFMCFFGVVVS